MARGALASASTWVTGRSTRGSTSSEKAAQALRSWAWGFPSTGVYLARLTPDAGITDVEFLGLSGADLAADPCGNAILALSHSGDTEVVVRHFRPATGWGPELAIEEPQTSIARAIEVGVAETGEAMVVVTRMGRYYYARYAAP